MSEGKINNWNRLDEVRLRSAQDEYDTQVVYPEDEPAEKERTDDVK